MVESAPSRRSQGRPRSKRSTGKHLSFADRFRLLDTHRKNPGWTYTQLAEDVGCSIETARVSCIAAGRDTADLMAAFAAPMLKLWQLAARNAAKRGDHRPAKEWLLHAGTIDPLPDTGRFGGTTINIVNSPLPGTTTSLSIDAADPQNPQNLAAPAVVPTVINIEPASS